VDSGVRQGDPISPHYDSMIAKLIVWGEDRAQALARLEAALAGTHLLGPATNVAFLRRVVGSRAFASADLDTALIEREHAALFEAPSLPAALVAAAVLAHLREEELRDEDADPWSRRDGWRLQGAAERRLRLRLGERTVEVCAQTPRPGPGEARLAVDGRACAFKTVPLGHGRHEVQLEGTRCVVTVLAHDDQLAVFGDAGSMQVTRLELGEPGDLAADEGRLTAPMPGRVVGFLIQPGERVRRGQPLAVMEAMKMEHTISAPHDGVVEELLYAVGDQVAEGGALLRLGA
jgi:3-methylcrotonyl-CoA carboxylase alpha subunit